MDKIAQVVLTKTQSGKWKVTVQSLKEIMLTKVFERHVNALAYLDDLEYPMNGWEQLSVD